MKNVISCPGCSAENPIYQLNCIGCKAYLRGRVVNVDFWKTIGSLLESPFKTFLILIQSEHKNFLIPTFCLFAIKFFINGLIFSHIVHDYHGSLNYLLLNLGLSVIYSLIILIAFSFIITRINKGFGIANRFRDNLTIYIFALVPQLITLIVLFPLEYAVFGVHWITFNPSPFVIRGGTAYIFAIIEGLMILWSLFLAISATYTQTKSKIYSVFVGFVYIIVIFGGMIFLPNFH